MMALMKPKTARAVSYNVGTLNAFTKKLSTLSRAFSLYIFEEVFLMLEAKGVLAQDASLSNPRTRFERDKLKRMQLKIIEFYKLNPVKVRSDIDDYVMKNLPKWSTDLSQANQKVAKWFVRNMTRDVTASQRQALMAAGFPSDFLKQKWTVPIVRGQYISPQAADKLQEIIEDTTSLITQMQLKDVQKLQEVIAEGLLNGENFRKIKNTLESFKDFDAARAKRVALDQSIKINQSIQRENAKSIGITQGIWVHVPGQYTSRETHKKMDGKTFKLDEGLFDSDVGHNVIPGSEYYCRCIWRPVLPIWNKQE